MADFHGLVREKTRLTVRARIVVKPSGHTLEAGGRATCNATSHNTTKAELALVAFNIEMNCINPAAFLKIESKCNEDNRNTATPGLEGANSPTTYGQLDSQKQLGSSSKPIKKGLATELERKLLPDRGRIYRNAWGLARRISGLTQDPHIAASSSNAPSFQMSDDMSIPHKKG
ncbi:Nitrogen assimilation transcription factor nit-4 [Fusarium oxysporum f. sp. albedinis]|nr:Sugar transporter STL1 [Fusarium oxysporum f. sp. albedinis]KAJ0133052.1 Nitrogen assimilation transcription factor nit-4 [Fusarium oxysporum f. sp. albedinis]